MSLTEIHDTDEHYLDHKKHAVAVGLDRSLLDVKLRFVTFTSVFCNKHLYKYMVQINIILYQLKKKKKKVCHFQKVCRFQFQSSSII